MSKLSNQSRQTLALLAEDENFKALIEDIAKTDVFNEKEKTRWSPENRLPLEDIIYNDALHAGRQQVLSFFRG